MAKKLKYPYMFTVTCVPFRIIVITVSAPDALYAWLLLPVLLHEHLDDGQFPIRIVLE